jgi:hypothetical protein
LGKAPRVLGIGIRDDVEIPRRTDHAVRVDGEPPMMMCTTPA